MENIDIDEWALNNGFNPLLIIQNQNGKDFFLAGILEMHLKEQLRRIYNQSPTGEKKDK